MYIHGDTYYIVMCRHIGIHRYVFYVRCIGICTCMYSIYIYICGCLLYIYICI